MKEIMVVDDERDVCDFVKSFFQERDFKVITAMDGKQALELLEKEKPLVILLDIRMPHMDGLETLRHIKQKRPATDVIMVTCVDDIDKMEEARRLGAATYITKPLVLDELVKAVMEKVSNFKPRKNL